MKKITTILATAFFAILFTSCKKDSADQWERFWGFTKDDVVGQYTANPDESLYEDLPTEGVKVYSDASLEIRSLSGDLISIQLTIPNVIKKVFSGTLYSDPSNSDLAIKNSETEDIRMTVYKNANGDVRLHGLHKRYYYDANHVVDHSDNYGFDVIKKAAR